MTVWICFSIVPLFSSVQFSRSKCVHPCDPMDCSARPLLSITNLELEINNWGGLSESAPLAPHWGLSCGSSTDGPVLAKSKINGILKGVCKGCWYYCPPESSWKLLNVAGPRFLSPSGGQAPGAQEIYVITMLTHRGELLIACSYCYHSAFLSQDSLHAPEHSICNHHPRWSPPQQRLWVSWVPACGKPVPLSWGFSISQMSKRAPRKKQVFLNPEFH